MSKLTKNEVAGWIRNIIRHIENPAYLVPKDYFKKQNDQIITQTEKLKALVELYKEVLDQ